MLEEDSQAYLTVNWWSAWLLYSESPISAQSMTQTHTDISLSCYCSLLKFYMVCEPLTTINSPRIFKRTRSIAALYVPEPSSASLFLSISWYHPSFSLDTQSTGWQVGSRTKLDRPSLAYYILCTSTGNKKKLETGCSDGKWERSGVRWGKESMWGWKWEECGKNMITEINVAWLKKKKTDINMLDAQTHTHKDSFERTQKPSDHAVQSTSRQSSKTPETVSMATKLLAPEF